MSMYTGCTHSHHFAALFVLWTALGSLCETPGMAEGEGLACELQEKFVAARPWVQELLNIRDSALDQIGQAFPLSVAPTTHAPNGVLRVPSLDGNASFVLRTYTGGEALPHVCTTTGMVPMGPGGMTLVKLAAHANMDKGTPFLALELGGGEASCLVALMMSARLNPVTHTDYVTRYYRSVPPGAEAQGVVPFTAIEQGMRARTVPYSAPGFIGDAKSSNSNASNASGGTAHQEAVGSSATGPGAAGNEAASQDASTSQQPQQPTKPAPVYRHFYSPALWTRLASGGTGALFSFDARDPGALAAVRADVARFVRLWTAWVQHDAGSNGSDSSPPSPLSGCDLAECKALSRVYANSVDHDEATKGAVMLFGQAAVSIMADTSSGAASAAAAGVVPWWAQA